MMFIMENILDNFLFRFVNFRLCFGFPYLKFKDSPLTSHFNRNYAGALTAFVKKRF